MSARGICLLRQSGCGCIHLSDLSLNLRLAGPQAVGESKLTLGLKLTDQLTLDLMLALFPPLLQLLPVIIQPLQTHDAILKAGSADTRHLSQGFGVAAFLPTGPQFCTSP